MNVNFGALTEYLCIGQVTENTQVQLKIQMRPNLGCTTEPACKTARQHLSATLPLLVPVTGALMQAAVVLGPQVSQH